MDKETLSNYGWVIVAVIVLGIMITLATPFGKYVTRAVSQFVDQLTDNAVKRAGDVLNGADSYGSTIDPGSLYSDLSSAIK